MSEVFFDDLDFGAFHALVSAESSDPSVGFAECFVEWVNLAYLAAEYAVLYALVEEVHAVLSDHASHFSNIGVVDLDLGVVSACDAVHEVVRLFEEAHRVECCEPGFGVDLPVHVEDCHAVDGEGRHLDAAVAKGVIGPSENLGWVSILELAVYRGEFFIGEPVENSWLDGFGLVDFGLDMLECQVLSFEDGQWGFLRWRMN